MNRMPLKWQVWPVLVFAASLSLYFPALSAETVQDSKQAGSERPFTSWQSPAKLRRTVGSDEGDLLVGADGIEFRSAKGKTIKLPYLEVQTFHLSPHGLSIETYQNRKMHMPGIERLRFDVTEAVPAAIASEFAMEVQRPSQNAIPDPAAQGIVIPAHHRSVAGGTNGMLRFRDGGIDYVTSAPDDSRSWRWADLQTLSSPDPYHLLAFGYRDTYSFDLKKSLPQSLYYRLVDAIDAHSSDELQQRTDTQAIKNPETPGDGVRNE
jgi:hypothetical protein